MLKSIEQLCGTKLEAMDGGIGHVKDFYFDDQNWMIRYVVVDTGDWLSGRQVLVSPHAFICLHEMGENLTINLTRKQIEESPSIEMHQPISRQYEEEYNLYYGWPYYWMGDSVWGSGGYSGVGQESEKTFPNESTDTHCVKQTRGEAHLRNTQEINGYRIQASDGMAGHVSDFMMDTLSWELRQMIIKTGHWPSSREVRIAMRVIERISCEESSVFIKMSSESVTNSPEHYPVMEEALV